MARRAWRHWAVLGAVAGSGVTAYAQVPDIISVFDAGSRALALGGATQATDITPHAALSNPAGLGYVSSPTLTVGIRNLPDFDLALSGTLGSPDREVDRTYGRTAFSHLGYALPFGRGALGFNFSVGGYSLYTSEASFLTSGTRAAVDYRSSFKAQSDFFTVSYGEDKGRYAWGLGAVYANQYLSLSESYNVFEGFNQVGTVNSSSSGNATGIGLIAGIQTPVGESGLWGFSVRTPIELNGNSQVKEKMPRIPGKASASYAVRRGLKAGSNDSIVYAAQADYHFGGSRNAEIERKDGVGFGLGVEYSLSRGGARWPIRLGYQSVPSLGRGFDSRQAYSFGLGWRPDGGRLGVDLGFLKDFRGGPFDASLGITYRFGD